MFLVITRKPNSDVLDTLGVTYRRVRPGKFMSAEERQTYQDQFRVPLLIRTYTVDGDVDADTLNSNEDILACQEL